MDIERRTFNSTCTIDKRSSPLADVANGYGVRGQKARPLVRGHAAVFNRLSEDLGGFRERIAPGAFDSVLQDDVRALFNHKEDHILGRTSSGTLRLSVDQAGLGYEIDMPDTMIARDLMTSLQRRDITQSSFGFTVQEDDWKDDPLQGVVRTVIKIRRLYDVSPVTYPAYPDADAGMASQGQRQQNHVPRSVMERYQQLIERL